MFEPTGTYAPATTRYDTMLYKRCGASGLKLPAISLGFWHNFGDITPYDQMKALVLTAFDHGITHFDLANNYGPEPGAAEKNAGRLIRQYQTQPGTASDQPGRPYGQPYAYQPPFGQQQPGQQQGQGGWEDFSPFRLIEEMLPQKAKNAIRGLYGIIGVAAIVLGVALLIWPGKTLGVAAVALGIYFVISGVIRIVSAIVTLGLPAGWRILDILIGIMLSVGGVLMLKNAALSGQSLAVFITMVVGLGWMMEGVMALAESWRLPSSGWAVLYAIISIIAGLVVLVSPVSSMLFLVIFCGCALIVMGVSSMVRAFKFGRPRRK